jgi:hypothetical protein
MLHVQKAVQQNADKCSRQVRAERIHAGRSVQGCRLGTSEENGLVIKDVAVLGTVLYAKTNCHALGTLTVSICLKTSYYRTDNAVKTTTGKAV